ncbi:hypothetical protein ABW21_db0209820 [Orbilia brochopaga]|nr:hypothetical protein ABW21_db0209820 [Drechslerella brochopaga]
MSLFSTLTTLAASTIVDSYKQAQPQAGARRITSGEHDPPLSTTRRFQEVGYIPPVPPHAVTMQPAGLPQNSIWTTMSYPIPRGPCLQKSSLISACSCQRFMVHPLKATSSFDCDGCGHHASFHKMKSHEDEVEQAARARDAIIEIHRESNMRSSVAMPTSRLDTDGEDEETLDGEDEDTAGRPARKRLAIENAGGEAPDGGARRGAAASRRGGAASSTRARKRKSVWEE